MVARRKAGEMVKVKVYKTTPTTLSFILVLYLQQEKSRELWSACPSEQWIISKRLLLKPEWTQNLKNLDPEKPESKKAWM